MRSESLFRGTKPVNQAETLAEAQRCLAQAIYFEARSEPVAGWEAVADVVINRALSPSYPGSICGVVFQGQYRRHKCQFSFACDGLSDRPKHRVLWRKALRMAGNKLVNVRAGPATAGRPIIMPIMSTLIGTALWSSWPKSGAIFSIMTDRSATFS